MFLLPDICCCFQMTMYICRWSGQRGPVGPLIHPSPVSLCSSVSQSQFGTGRHDINFTCHAGLMLRPHSMRPRSRHSPRGRCMSSVQDCLQAVAACCLSVILIHIGENDIGHISTGEILREILLLVTKLSDRCHCPVYVCQLLT